MDQRRGLPVLVHHLEASNRRDQPDQPLGWRRRQGARLAPSPLLINSRPDLEEDRAGQVGSLWRGEAGNISTLAATGWRPM